MDNNGILAEIRELEKSGDLPQKVSNRLLLAGIIKNAAKSDKNASSIAALVANESENKNEIGALKKLTALLFTLITAMLGWTIFAG